MLTSLLSNPVEIWSKEHFEQSIVVNATALGHRIVVSDPTAIKRVLVDNTSNYVRDDLQRRILLRTTDHSLFSAEDDRWRWQRRSLTPIFTRNRLADYIPGMVAAAAAATSRLAGAAESSSTDISAEMAHTTLDVLARSILPDAMEEDGADVAVSIRKFADAAGAVSLADLLSLPPWFPGLRQLCAIRASRTVAERARRIVAHRRAAVGSEECAPAGDLGSPGGPQNVQITRRSSNRCAPRRPWGSNGCIRTHSTSLADEIHPFTPTPCRGLESHPRANENCLVERGP